MTHKEHLVELQKLLVEAPEFKTAYTYFFDHLGEDKTFLDNGKTEVNPALEAILGAIGGELLKKPVKASHFMIIRVKDEPFLHGSCMLPGHLMTFFYFEDIGKGMAATVSVTKRDYTNFIRFSGHPVPAPTEPSVN